MVPHFLETFLSRLDSGLVYLHGFCCHVLWLLNWTVVDLCEWVHCCSVESFKELWNCRWLNCFVKSYKFITFEFYVFACSFSFVLGLGSEAFCACESSSVCVSVCVPCPCLLPMSRPLRGWYWTVVPLWTIVSARVSDKHHLLCSRLIILCCWAAVKLFDNVTLHIQATFHGFTCLMLVWVIFSLHSFGRYLVAHLQRNAGCDLCSNVFLCLLVSMKSNFLSRSYLIAFSLNLYW